MRYKSSLPGLLRDSKTQLSARLRRYLPRLWRQRNRLWSLVGRPAAYRVVGSVSAGLRSVPRVEHGLEREALHHRGRRGRHSGPWTVCVLLFEQRDHRPEPHAPPNTR